MSKVMDTLLWPFQQSILSVPDNARLALFRPEPEAGLAAFITGQHSDVDQPFYTTAQAFKSGEITDGYDAALCALPKQKEEAHFILARAFQCLKQGGVLAAAAANDAGGKRIVQSFEALGLDAHSESKNKARVVWAAKHKESDIVHDWIKAGSIQPILDGAYQSQPGIFGWNAVDEASSLLLSTLPDLKGRGADFGCGYGFLTREAMGKGAQSMTAYDHDARAVECCKLNNPEAEVIWSDLRQPLKVLPYHFIVMNPPFHSGKKTDIELGQSFIRNARACLKPKGMLYMVANRHLPYERILETEFTAFDVITEKKGFKVIYAAA